MTAQSKLIPILRDGIDVIKMVFYKRLKEQLGPKYHSKGEAYINRICGALVNRLFGVENMEARFDRFVKENEAVIRKEIGLIATELDDMRIPLTDALRIQFLCDSLNGLDSESILKRAEKEGILIIDRPIPLPKNFMNLARMIGEQFNLVEHVDIQPEEKEGTESGMSNRDIGQG